MASIRDVRISWCSRSSRRPSSCAEGAFAASFGSRSERRHALGLRPPRARLARDFGKKGITFDPETRRTRTLWLLIVTLVFRGITGRRATSCRPRASARRKRLRWPATVSRLRSTEDDREEGRQRSRRRSVERDVSTGDPKGAVERLVGWGKHALCNHWKLQDEADLRAQLPAWLVEVNEKTSSRATGVILETRRLDELPLTLFLYEDRRRIVGRSLRGTPSTARWATRLCPCLSTVRLYEKRQPLLNLGADSLALLTEITHREPNWRVTRGLVSAPREAR